MPESLAFAAPLPSFVFQNVAFEASVRLVDENKATVTGVSKELAVTVRFHDSYDIVPDQSDVIDVVQRPTIDPASGQCRFGVVLKSLTASNDARPFCIEVRSADGAVESVFSTPLTVVKEKLRIVQQPPDVWFKDEGGREKCMTVSLVLEPAPGAVVEDRVIPLDIRLLYESGNQVLNQSILRLFPDMRPNMTRGRVTVSFRIDDVSKNHQGQSFILEVAPEKQESSLMFQDIAPARTSVIAIRSKRNKRKLAGGVPGTGVGGGMRASPRSVAGTPRANLMMLHQPSAMASNLNNPMVMTAGPSPGVQRQQRRVLHGTPTNNQFGMMTGHQQHPSSARGDMGMAPPTPTWSSHLQQQQQMGTPMNHAAVSTPMHAPTPMPSPAHSAAAATNAAVEWKLAGFEIHHSDGSQNVSRPIYRCPHCKRLNDVEMMSNGLAEHSPQCVFSSLMYRSQLEGAAAGQQQQQLQQQQLQQQIQQMNQQHYLATHGTPRAYHQPQVQVGQSSSMSMSRAAAHTASMAPLDVTTTDIHATYQVNDNDSDPTADSADHSPKTLAALMGSSSSSTGTGGSHRPVLTISPYMNKVTTGSDDSGSDASPAGNLFASNAFRNQMEISEVTSHLGIGPDKQLQASASASSFFEEKPEHEEHDPTANDDTGSDHNNQQQQLSLEDNSVTLSVGVGTALFNEMSSMGISLDQFDQKPVGGFNPLADFAEMSDEDQVFYILARMYTDVQNRKLGLPAFDQFQRMLGFYTESQNDVQTQVLFHALEDVGLPEKEQVDITNRFTLELQQHSDAVHSLPKYQHNLVMLREDALMYYWSQSIQSFGVN